MKILSIVVEGFHAGKLMIASRKCFAEAPINGNQAIKKHFVILYYLRNQNCNEIINKYR
jgi:hypothetical protein